MEAFARRGRLRSFLLASMLCVAVVTTACTGSGDDAPREPEAPDPAAVVEGFDPSVDARSAVGDIHAAALADREALLAVALDDLGSTDPEVHWAAVYALSITVTAEDTAAVDALTELLASSDVDERLNAAGALAAIGRKDALPVLIEMLDAEDTLRFIVLPAWRVAAGMLLANTEEDFGVLDALDPQARAEAKAAWESWWAERGPELVWQPDGTTFV